jgi:1-phosphatidylinositol phosphodiesterase
MATNLKKWMGEIGNEKPLFSLSIPGTHDSAARYVQYAHIAKCQDMSIFDQLSIGVRALDIRVMPEGNRLLMIHGIAKVYYNSRKPKAQMDLEYILTQIYAFLKENPSESVIIQFKNDSGKDFEKSFDNLYKTYIKPNKDKWYLENRCPALGEARGKIVLVRRCLMDKKSSEYTEENSGIDFSSWVEQVEMIPDALVLKTGGNDGSEFIIQDRFKYKAEDKWAACIKPFLKTLKPFDKQYVICYFSTAGGISGPKKNATLLNNAFINYPIPKAINLGTIYLDFPTKRITSKIIERNIL